MSDPRRRIPRTDALLDDPALSPATALLGRHTVKTVVLAIQDRARAGQIPPEDVLPAVLGELPKRPMSISPVLNATGVIIHTNLGRAPLSPAAVQALIDAAGYTDVEFDLSTGARARRGAGALAAIRDAVPDAGDVHVVNNNAAALMLCACALAQDKEVVLSKGELVEIGDGFRVPELLASSGARLREVGTTNRTTVCDFAEALGEKTGFVLKVHPSNFRISGFTSTPALRELTELGVPVVADIGSGLFGPHPGLSDEPDAASALQAGAALVTASGDKLIGGPQAGLILGEADLVHQLRRHPVARAMRVDKLVFAALEATLRGPESPVKAALRTPHASLRERAERIASSLQESGVDATVVDTESVVGGGGAPGVPLWSAAVSVPADYLPRLRSAGVVGRLEHDRSILDLRAIPETDDRRLMGLVMRCR